MTNMTQGFFVPYLTGGISIVVLALGSTAPGLLGFFINKFSTIFPDYRERVLGHEAAHFLVRLLRIRRHTWPCDAEGGRLCQTSSWGLRQGGTKWPSVAKFMAETVMHTVGI